MKETNTVGVTLAQTEDTTGANVDASIANVGERLQTLVIGPGGDNGGVEFTGGVEVVVVCGQTGILQFLGLVLVDHAESDTDLHVHLADAGDHLLDVLQTGLAAAHVSPGGTHAEPGAAVGFGIASLGEHVVDGAHLGSLQSGVVLRGLGTVRAIFTTSSGLDVHESAHLNSRGIMEPAVDRRLGYVS